jgi:hypothetical protein
VLAAECCDEIDKIVWLITVNNDVGRERPLVVRRLRAMIDRGDTPDPDDLDQHLRTQDLPTSMVNQITRIYRMLLNGRVMRDYTGQPI